MKVNKTFRLVKLVFSEFFKEDSLMHGASLAYYTILAMAPLLYLSITFFGRFVGNDMMTDIISNILSEQIGITDISGILDFLATVDFTKSSVLMRIIGFIALLFSASAIFNSLSNSINVFYGLKTVELDRKNKILKTLILRFISMVFIMGITTTVIILYVFETLFLSLGHKLLSDLTLLDKAFTLFAQHGLPILTNIIVFTFVFKFLHHGVVRWKMALQGSFITSISLYIGQLLLKYYLSNYFFASDGGVLGTMLIILVWVYYSSQIIFLGAKIIAVKSKLKGFPITFRK